MRVVVSYIGPDMDGTSCMFAYSELLNKLGIKSNYFIWGTPKKEVGIVCDLFNIKLGGLTQLKSEYDYIAVDLNGLDQMHEIVTVNNLIEIIDHHSVSKYVPTYVNAKIQIEQVGAAASLVAEKFKENNIKPSRDAAILLYYGIISNSINLKAHTTTDKDIEMTEWLKKQCDEISEEKIKEIFEAKSKIEDKDLRTEMECEIPLVVDDKGIIVAQLEVANLEEFLIDKKEKIVNVLSHVKEEKNPDYIYINCVDILNGYTIVIGCDDDSNRMVEDVFGISMTNGIGKVDDIIQRKEMTRKLREVKKW